MTTKRNPGSCCAQCDTAILPTPKGSALAYYSWCQQLPLVVRGVAATTTPSGVVAATLPGDTANQQSSYAATDVENGVPSTPGVPHARPLAVAFQWRAPWPGASNLAFPAPNSATDPVESGAEHPLVVPRDGASLDLDDLEQRVVLVRVVVVPLPPLLDSIPRQRDSTTTRAIVPPLATWRD